MCELLPCKVSKLFRTRRFTWPQHNGTADIFAQRGMWKREGSHVAHGRMFGKHNVNLIWENFLTTAIDNLLQASTNEEMT